MQRRALLLAVKQGLLLPEGKSALPTHARKMMTCTLDAEALEQFQASCGIE